MIGALAPPGQCPLKQIGIFHLIVQVLLCIHLVATKSEAVIDIDTRKHSSGIRTTRLPPLSHCHSFQRRGWADGSPSRGSPGGQVVLLGDSPSRVATLPYLPSPPPPVNRHTPVKTLSSRNLRTHALEIDYNSLALLS